MTLGFYLPAASLKGFIKSVVLDTFIKKNVDCFRKIFLRFFEGLAARGQIKHWGISDKHITLLKERNWNFGLYDYFLLGHGVFSPAPFTAHNVPEQSLIFKGCAIMFAIMFYFVF